MNAYISYDGKYYATVAKNWSPVHQKPASVRLMADGSLDISFGNGVLKMFRGEIVASPDETRTGYGTSSDLETSLDKMQTVTLVDHHGDSHTCVCKGWKRRSLHPRWDSAKQYYEVELLYV